VYQCIQVDQRLVVEGFNPSHVEVSTAVPIDPDPNRDPETGKAAESGTATETAARNRAKETVPGSYIRESSRMAVRKNI